MGASVVGSPLQRGFVMGYRRARHKVRAEMRSMAAHFDAEIEALQHDFREIAVELHRHRYDRHRPARGEPRRVVALALGAQQR